MDVLTILDEYERFAQAALESSSVFNGRKITEQVMEDIWESLS